MIEVSEAPGMSDREVLCLPVSRCGLSSLRLCLCPSRRFIARSDHRDVTRRFLERRGDVKQGRGLKRDDTTCDHLLPDAPPSWRLRQVAHSQRCIVGAGDAGGQSQLLMSWLLRTFRPSCPTPHTHTLLLSPCSVYARGLSYLTQMTRHREAPTSTLLRISPVARR